MEKITNKSALTYIVDTYGDTLPEGMTEKLNGMIAQLAKKSTGTRKPTAVQTANEGYKAAILDYLTDTGAVLSISDLIKAVPEISELTNQRVSAIVRQMVDAHVVTRTVEKRKAYFSVTDADGVQALPGEITE